MAFPDYQVSMKQFLQYKHISIFYIEDSSTCVIPVIPLTMTISREGCFNRHVAPRAVEQTSIVMHCVLPLHELQTDIIGHTLH